MLNNFFKIIENTIPIKWRTGFNHPGFKRYFSNTGWMFLGRIFTFGVTFLMGVYIARYLGPSDYGLLNYAISFVGLFAFLTSFGIDSIVSREIIKNPDKKDQLIGSAFYIKIIGSILAIVSVNIVALSTTTDIATLCLILLFSLTFIPQAFNIIEIYFQSQVLSKKAVIAQVVSSLISALLKIVCIVLGKDIFWIMSIYVIEISIYAFVLLLSFKTFGKRIGKWKLDSALAVTLLKDSWPLMLAFISGSIYLRIDQVMIKNMLSNEALGLFSVGVKLSEIWYLIPVILCTSLSPALLNARKVDYSEFLKRLSKLYFALFWFAVVIIIPILLYPDFITKTLFGAEYGQASGVLSIYVLSCIPVFLWTVLNQFLISENYVKIMLLQSVTVAILNVILNFTLIPPFGINGAAIATLVSYTVGLLFYVFFKKTRGQIVLIATSILKIRHA